MNALEGVRVIDLTMGWSGPVATRFLGDLGAEVVRVEAPWSRGPADLPDSAAAWSGRYPGNIAGDRPYNREGIFNGRNWNKLSLAVHLDRPEGRGLLRELVGVSDVLVENFSPPVLAKFGLARESIVDINPRLVLVSMPGFGLEGPYGSYVSYGPTLEPAAGHTALMGYPDSGPYLQTAAWSDGIAAANAALAALAGLMERRATGRGQVIELAQVEALVNTIGEVVAGCSLGIPQPARWGSAHPDHVPYNVYPCRGDDRWLAITTRTDGEFAALCAAVGRPDLATDARFATAEARRAHRAEVDAFVSAWAAGQDRDEAMRGLQGAGVPAGAVLDARGMLEDPHLAARGFYQSIDHPDTGPMTFAGFPFRLDVTPPAVRLRAPLLGEHNRRVVCDILGRPEAEYEALVEQGVLATEPPSGGRAARFAIVSDNTRPRPSAAP